MISDPLIFAATSDLAGVTRGKAFPLGDLDKRLKRGVGWVPTNAMITCFDVIGDSPTGLHHVAFWVDDLDAATESLAE